MVPQSKPTERKLLLVLIILPFILGLGMAGYGYVTRDNDALEELRRASEPLREGVMAPDFTFPDLKGRPVSLSQFKGKKVVFINIWATWCPTCVEEMASMEELYQRMKGEDFEILAVSIDALGKDIVAPFMKKHRLTFSALLDPMGKSKRLYRTTGVPESFIIDKSGRIIRKVIGPLDWSRVGVRLFLTKLARASTDTNQGMVDIKLEGDRSKHYTRPRESENIRRSRQAP